MKKLPLSLLALCGALITLAPMRSNASVAVSFDFFYDELAPYGNWIDVDGYGYCFQPQVASGWRPYYNGDWIYTDAGWAWNSSESWGWATYHYGRWANVGGCGWVWVPGYDWAPAWVSWRTGGDYIGWAPLPPECGWNGSRISFGVSFGFDIGPSYYNFCSPRYFGYGNIGRYCAPWRNNVNIIQQTTNITNITNVVNNNTTIINSGGPNYDFVRRNSDRPIRRAQIERVTAADGLRKGGALKNDLRGDKLRVVSPKIANNKNAKPKQVAARASSKNVDRGWSDIKDPSRAKKLRENMKNEAKVAANRSGNQNQNRANTRDGQGAKARTGNAQNQSTKNTAKNTASKTAGNDRTKVGSGLKPFLGQEQRNRDKSPADRKQDQVRAERQQQIAKDQRQREQAQKQGTADVRRNADVDAARRQQQGRPQQQQSRREQVLRQQAQYETARRQPQQQQVQRPAQQQRQQAQSQQRRPQPLQRQGQPQQRQQVQRPPQQQRQAQQRQQPQQRSQPAQQQRPAQSQKKKDDRPQAQRSFPSQMQRPPQVQRQSQPQMQRPQQPQRQSSPNGGGNRKSSNDDGRKRS